MAVLHDHEKLPTNGRAKLSLLPPVNVVCEGYVIQVSVYLRGEGVVVSQHALQVSRPTSRGDIEGSGLGRGSPGQHPGEKLRGLAWGGGLRPTPRGSPGPHLGVSRPTLRQTPPSRQLLLRVVRILLECILVKHPTGMHSC